MNIASNIARSNLEQIINILIIAKKAYSEGEPIFNDEDFDRMEEMVRESDPTNEYFIGVGSSIRGEKVKLPYPMGSLDQVYEGDFEKWVNRHDLEEEIFVITSKMDGISGQIIYNSNGELQIAYSRGDGIEGADITRHIKKIPNVPLTIPTNTSTAIRIEIEMSHSQFKEFSEDCEKYQFKIYKNARNAVAGLINSEEIPEWVYQHISVIAYEIINSNTSKLEQLQMLEKFNFLIVYYLILKGSEIDDASLIKILKYNIMHFNFEQDGVVIDTNCTKVQERLTNERDRQSLNPAYAKKFKIKAKNNFVITECKQVEWNPSKNGLLKPRVEFESFNLGGVTISYATGHNAKFIVDNKIGPGAKLKITRSGDVIPYILEVVEPALIISKPDPVLIGEYEWNENEVEYKLLENNEEVTFKQVLSFFESLSIDNLKEGSLVKFFEIGLNTEAHIINSSKEQMIELIGKNGNKIFDSIHKVLNNIPEYKFAGATSCFGVGVGVRKLKPLYEKYGKIYGLTYNEIMNVKGFEEITANKIVEGMNDYQKLIYSINSKILNFSKIQEIPENNELEGMTYTFTGIRDKNAQSIIESKGGKIGSGVSKNTTHLVCKDPTSTSSKMEKARKLGIKIISLEELHETLI